MQQGRSSCSAAAFWHFDCCLQGDLACRHAREGSNLVRSHKQSGAGIGQHLDGKLNFAGDNVGNSIDGSLTSESGLSKGAWYEELEVPSFRGGAKIRYQAEKTLRYFWEDHDQLLIFHWEITFCQPRSFKEILWWNHGMRFKLSYLPLQRLLSLVKSYLVSVYETRISLYNPLNMVSDGQQMLQKWHLSMDFFNF